MVTFTSAHSRFATYLGKKKIAFHEGLYRTDVEEEINHLRNHKEYGRSLIENGKIGKKTNIVTDLRTGGLEELKAKFREYEELKSKCLKADGSPRKDAIESDLSRLNELKQELEL